MDVGRGHVAVTLQVPARVRTAPKRVGPRTRRGAGSGRAGPSRPPPRRGCSRGTSRDRSSPSRRSGPGAVGAPACRGGPRARRPRARAPVPRGAGRSARPAGRPRPARGRWPGSVGCPSRRRRYRSVRRPPRCRPTPWPRPGAAIMVLRAVRYRLRRSASCSPCSSRSARIRCSRSYWALARRSSPGQALVDVDRSAAVRVVVGSCAGGIRVGGALGAEVRAAVGAAGRGGPGPGPTIVGIGGRVGHVDHQVAPVAEHDGGGRATAVARPLVVGGRGPGVGIQGGHQLTETGSGRSRRGRGRSRSGRRSRSTARVRSPPASSPGCRRPSCPRGASR